MSMSNFFFLSLDLPFSATKIKRWKVDDADAFRRTAPIIEFRTRMARIRRTATGVTAREMVAR